MSVSHPPKRILAIGQEPESIEDLIAWYLLKVIYGDRLVSVFANEEKDIPPVFLGEDYAEIFLLNNPYDDLVAFLQRAEVVFLINNLPFATTIGQPDKPFWQGREFSESLLFQDGAQTFTRMVSAHDTRPNKGYRSLASVLINALSYARTGQWWLQPTSIIESPVLGILLATNKNLIRGGNLMATLQMLDSLPAYASRQAARLHDKLDALSILEQPGAEEERQNGVYRWTYPSRSYDLLDRVFQDPHLLEPLLAK